MTGGLPRVPIADPDDRRPEPDQRCDRQRPGDTDEVAREPQRQVRLEQQDDTRHLGDRPRDAWDELGHDRDREQGDHRCEDQHQVAMDRSRVPQVVDHDHDEDQDECRLKTDIDGVHESLGTAPRGWDRIDRTILAGNGASTADVSRFANVATLREHDRVLQPHNRSSAFDGIAPRPDGGVQSQAPGSHLVGPKRAMDRIPTMARTSFSPPEATIVVSTRRLLRRVSRQRPRRTATSPPTAASWPNSDRSIRGTDDRLAVRPDSIALADAVTAWSAVNGAAALGGASAAAVTATSPAA